ncbi:MAG TPA: conjugal transfer protein TraF [Vicinamibacterales bacterium]|nr:conjugal transfer protein TraF [Vicinamibacterales bacterium]
MTLLTSVFTGVHVGTTLKFLRGGVEHTSSDVGLTPEGEFDADLGVLAVAGPWRVGGVVKNLFEAAEFGEGAGLDGITLSRQARVGVAFDGGARRGSNAAWTLSADVDVASYATNTGDRRVIAAGAERWLVGKRIGVRGGARFNQVGQKERSATGGVSAAIRPGLFVEAHGVAGGSDDERGWGVAARVSF